jgi:hypothetical protein
MKNQIVTEVRAAREAYAKQHNYDLADICADLRRRQTRSKRVVVSLSEKKRKPSSAVTAR